MGSKGCFAAEKGKKVRLPAFKVKVVDTTGAGDVFNAGFAVSYLRGESLEYCAKFASAAAAISITGEGWSRYPSLSQVEEFLSRF
jgi:ribokinase